MSLLVRAGTTSFKTQNQVVSDLWLHGSFLRGCLVRGGLRGGAQGKNNPPAPCLPWGDGNGCSVAGLMMPWSCPVLQLVSTTWSKSGHPAVTMRWLHCHASVWAICWKRNKRHPQNGSQTCHNAREKCGVEVTCKICAVKKSPSWMLHWILRLPEAYLHVPVAVPA